MEDEALATALQQGDVTALAPLVERHHQRLFGYLFRLTNGNHCLAEDLAQESFVRVLHHIRHYQAPRPFKPWLYQIATNLARDYYKQAETRRVVPLAEDSAALPASGSLDDNLQQAEAVQELLAALPTLSDTQRATLILRYYQGFTLLEIAETLNLPLGTVKSRLNSAINRLRAALRAKEAL